MFFHNRRVAKRISDAVDRIEVEFEPIGRMRLPPATVPAALPPTREKRREIMTAKGRRIRVVERGASCQLQLNL